MNIEADLAEAEKIIWRDKPGVRNDVARIVEMWSELLAQHGGPLLFSEFSIADAYFAPVCMLPRTFALPVPEAITAYVQRVAALPGVTAWIDGALAEKDFLDFEEPPDRRCGAVRDALMGLPVHDRNWVVVGVTPEARVKKGFVPVGKDFPVFLHPTTCEESALARIERTTAPGYRGLGV